MMKDHFSHSAGEWLSPGGPENDVVISTRARLARNVLGMKMPWRMTAAEKSALEATLREKIEQSGAVDKTTYFNLSKIEDLWRQFLVERHLISRELAQSHGDRGVAFSPTESTSIMTNEEDHLRIQAIRAGFRIAETWQIADRVDDMLATTIEYAFSPTLGYLTACPTNVGTGLRISVMAHLPTLVASRQIDKVRNATSQVGLVMRGLYGEGTKSYGDFFQISNQVTLGRSEKEIVGAVRDVVTKIVEWERGVRRSLLRKDCQGLIASVAEARQSLELAEHISFEDAMRRFSTLRLGIFLGLAEDLSAQALNELLLLTQPAHLQVAMGAPLAAHERDRVRADFIRTRLKSDNN